MTKDKTKKNKAHKRLDQKKVGSLGTNKGQNLAGRGARRILR